MKAAYLEKGVGGPTHHDEAVMNGARTFILGIGKREGRFLREDLCPIHRGLITMSGQEDHGLLGFILESL